MLSALTVKDQIIPFRLSPYPALKLSINTLCAILVFFFISTCVAQGPNPQTGMRVIGSIKLSGACENDTLKMENLTKDSARTVKYYVHCYNYFNDPFYPQIKDTVYTKANGSHIYNFDDSLVLSKCYRSVNLYFGIIAYDTFGLDYPVISRITIYLRPRAIFNTDSVICAGEQLTFNNLSCKDSTKFKWIFSDTVSTAKVPQGISFDTAGKQTIKLVASTTSPCVQADTAVQDIEVLKVPKPGFRIVKSDYSPFKDSVICLGDTLYLIDTSRNRDKVVYHYNPSSNFTTSGKDTVRLVMVQKGLVGIRQEALNKACSRFSRNKNILVIQNPFVRINPLPACLDSLSIDLDKYVDTGTGVPKQVIWSITGNGLDIKKEVVFPGKLTKLAYGKYHVKVISVGGCRTLMSSDSFFVSPPVGTPRGMSFCKGADTTIFLNRFFNFPKGFAAHWNGPVNKDSLFTSVGKNAGTYTPVMTDKNSGCYQVPVSFEIVGSGAGKIPEQHLCLRFRPVLPLDGLIPADFQGKGVARDTFFSKRSGAGVFDIAYTTTIKSCRFTDSLRVIVHDTSTPVFSFINPGCKDSPIIFNQQSRSNDVLWEFGDGQSSSLLNPAHAYRAAGDYTARLIQGVYCFDTLSKPVKIYGSPAAGLQISTDTLNCDSVIVKVRFTNKGYGESYRILYAQEVFYGDSVRFAVAKSFQPRTIKIAGIASSRCGSNVEPATIRIPQRNYAAIEILGLNPGCHGDSLKLVNLSYGPADSFVVDYGNGSISRNRILKLPYFNNSTVLKTYPVSIRVYSKYCGILNDTTYYKVIPNVIRAAGEHNKNRLCSYDQVTFINNSTQGADYQLYFGDGGSSKGSVYHQAVSYQYLIPGVYVPYIKAVSVCGVDSAVMDTIRVNAAPKVDLSNTRSKMCLGSEIYLKYTPSDLLNPKWYVNHQLTDSLLNPFVFHPKATGTYRISVIASNQFCVGLDSFDIQVESAPDIQIGVRDVTCDTIRAEIYGNYTLGNLVVNWGDGITDFAKLYHVYADTGLYLIKMTLTEGLCTLYFEREIRVKSPPKFRLLIDPPLSGCLEPGDTIRMSVGLDSMPYQVDLYNWAGERVCRDCDRNMMQPDFMNCQPKEFKVVVRDRDLCRTEQKISYSCFDPGSSKYKAYIPNAFTPKNGDLLNDNYLPRMAYYDSGMVYQLKIFNRWGEMVFETSDPAIGWDGTYRGNVSPMDVYVYIIEYGCPGHRFNSHRGTLHLLR
jgi:gliding motility-associated-like protein